MNQVQEQSMTAPALVYNESINNESIRLAYDEAVHLRTFYSDWADSIDTKTVAIFSVGGAIMGVAPLFQKTPHGWALAAWLVALICWGLAAYFSFHAYKPRDFRAVPDPNTFIAPEWRSLSPEEFRFYRLRDMGKSFDQNRDTLKDKAHSLRLAVLWSAAEIFALAIAFMLG